MRLSETEINVEHTDRRVCVKRSNTTRPPLAVFGRAVFGPRNRYVEGVMYWLSETSEWMMQVIICLRTTRHWKWKHKGKETAHTAVDNVPTTFLCLSTCTNTPSPSTGNSTVFRCFLHTSLYKFLSEGNSPSRESLRRLTRSFIIHDWMH